MSVSFWHTVFSLLQLLSPSSAAFVGFFLWLFFCQSLLSFRGSVRSSEYSVGLHFLLKFSLGVFFWGLVLPRPCYTCSFSGCFFLALCRTPFCSKGVGFSSSQLFLYSGSDLSYSPPPPPPRGGFLMLFLNFFHSALLPGSVSLSFSYTLLHRLLPSSSA